MNIPLKRPPVPRHEEPEKREFPYGWRFVKRQLPDGTETLDQVPLTLDDALHPQEGDVIPENYVHEKERGDIARIFRQRMHRFDQPIVMSDCIIDWNVPGLRNHSPDVSMFVDLRKLPEPNETFGTFRLAKFGGRCILAMEIVSPDTRVNDGTYKLKHYHTAGVPLYIIIDQKRENGPRTLHGYRHAPDGFEEIPTDEQGCLSIEPLRLLIGLRDNLAVCFDADSGEVVPTWEEEAELRRNAEKKAVKAEQNTQKARERAKLSEEKAKQAMQEAKKEAKARKDLEKRLREMEAKLKMQENGE